MLRALRITLMWLIAVAVPVQGSAALAMLGCAPGHHGGMARTQMTMADPSSHDADPASLGAIAEEVRNHSHDSHPHDAGAPHDHSGSLEAHGSVHKVAKGNCTPCASCCVVAALPAAMVHFEPLPRVDIFVLTAPSSVSSFLADGLERPPRLLLA